MYRKVNFANTKAKAQFKRNKKVLPIVYNFDEKYLNQEVIPAYKLDQKKLHVIYGEITFVLSKEQFEEVTKNLKATLNAIDTYKTKGISRKTFMLDFIYITSIPLALYFSIPFRNFLFLFLFLS